MASSSVNGLSARLSLRRFFIKGQILNELQLRSDDDIPMVIGKIDMMLAEAKTIPELNKVGAIASAMKELGKKAGISLHAKNKLTERYIEIRARRGVMLKQMKEDGRLREGRPKKLCPTGIVSLNDLGLTLKDSSRDQMLADLPKERRAELSLEADNMAKEFAMSMCLAEVARNRKGERIEELKQRETLPADGEYDVIVIDPPWKMEMIEREVRPNQAKFDYPTMTEDELKELEIPASDDCHLWLWTTHKNLPSALCLLEAWGFRYVCTFVWHKPGGFQPVGLPQYNSEFALYARRGTPIFESTKDFPVCFNAKRGAHSEKPQVFYEMIKRVTAGRRLDMFSRRGIDGFDAWGNEA